MNKRSIHSLNTKITLAFITIGFIILAILFIQIIPRLIEKQQIDKNEQMNHMITLTENQLKFAIELIINERERKVAIIRQWFDKSSEVIAEQLTHKNDIQSVYLNSIQPSGCQMYVLDSFGKTFFKSTNEEFIADKKEQLESNTLLFYTEKQRHMCPKTTRSILYERSLFNQQRLILECQPTLFHDRHNNFEARIKEDLQKSFNLTHTEHKGKINLIWINTKHPYYDSQPLLHDNDKVYNERYCLSRMSSATELQTGKLTAQQIVMASNNGPISHTIYENGDIQKPKEALTWVRTLNDKTDRDFYFLMTVYEEDFNKNLYDPLLKIMPAGVFSLITAIFLGVIIFRRMFKSIAILTNTVKEVNAGNRSIRNHLKGNDDIALLAQLFDSMMDSIEENILQLDAKVALKTQQIQSSLKEKETLLKEIHHRVKNNLAMTINLIKLQKVKVKDKKSQEVLTDIQERIFTMELLHRKLYESQDLNSIDMPKYIEELVHDLLLTYQIQNSIKSKLELDSLQMHIEYALPCGLIITECVINSLKYAFKNDREGLIGVKLYIKNNNVYLHIYDDGIGLPLDLNIYNSKTLGLKIITSLSKNQLQGSIDYSFKNGTYFEVSFEMNDVP